MRKANVQDNAAKPTPVRQLFSIGKCFILSNRLLSIPERNIIKEQAIGRHANSIQYDGFPHNANAIKWTTKPMAQMTNAKLRSSLRNRLFL